MFRSSRIGKRTIAVAIVLAAASAIGAGYVAAQRGAAPPDVQSLDAAIKGGLMRKVAGVPGAEGYAPRGVFVQELDVGYLCVWDAPTATSRERQGGCNPLDDPLGGAAISANLAYEGGPAVEAVRDARIAGLARSEAARIHVLMSDGSTRRVRASEAVLRSGEFQAFGYRLHRADLSRGIGPIAVVALDVRGREIGRQPTGIG